jgi:Tfp pilus assembly protein PilO
VVLSKRERYIGIGAGTAVGLLLLNSFLIDPLMGEAKDLETQTSSAQDKLTQSQNVVKKSAQLSPRWTEMNRSGLLKDSSAAESQIYNAVAAWARDAGLDPQPALKSDRTEKQKDFYQITIRATGAGSMDQIARFLWRIQTASFPIRITDLSLSSRKEGTDDLALQMSLATAYLSTDTDASKQTNASAGQGGQQ